MASAVESLPGLPQDTGFAASNTGSVLRTRLVVLLMESIEGQICFQEQSKATSDPPMSMILQSSGPCIEPQVGSSNIPLDGEPVMFGCNMANPAADIILAVHFFGSSWLRCITWIGTSSIQSPCCRNSSNASAIVIPLDEVRVTIESLPASDISLKSTSSTFSSLIIRLSVGLVPDSAL